MKEAFAELPAQKGGQEIKPIEIKKTLSVVEKSYQKSGSIEIDKKKLSDLIFKNTRVGDLVAFLVEKSFEKETEKAIEAITGSRKSTSIKLGRVQGSDESKTHIYVEGEPPRKPKKASEIMNISWLFERDGWKKLPDMMSYDEFEQFKKELEKVIEEKRQEQKVLTAKKSSPEGRAYISHPEDEFPYQVGDTVSFREKGGEVLSGTISGHKYRIKIKGEYKEPKLIVKVKAEKGGKEDNYVVSSKDILRKE